MSSEARQRKQPSQQTKSVLAQLDKHGRYKRTAPARPPKKPARSLHLGISFLLLACLLIYAQRSGVGKKGAYTVDGGARPLPSWYAVCSKEGKKIYTVPVAGGEGAVECVVVGDKEVVDTGSLAHVRRHWGDRSAGGAAADAPEHIKKQKGLKVVYLPPGHTLTPGLIDGHGHALDYGASRGLRLETAKTLSETVGLVEAYVAAHKPRAGDWVFGGGWDQTQWPVKDFPTAVRSGILRGVRRAARTNARLTLTRRHSAVSPSSCTVPTCTPCGCRLRSSLPSARSPTRTLSAARSSVMAPDSPLACSSTTRSASMSPLTCHL